MPHKLRCLVRHLLTFICLVSTPALAQSVWFELGWGYDETSALEFASGAKIGVRGVYPLNRSLGVYLSPYVITGLGVPEEWNGLAAGVDGGVWYDFRTTPQDLEGFHSYAGVGLSVIKAQFGAVISGAFSYDVGRDLELALIFNYRPLILPDLSQAFDISLGLRYDLD